DLPVTQELGRRARDLRLRQLDELVGGGAGHAEAHAAEPAPREVEPVHPVHRPVTRDLRSSAEKGRSSGTNTSLTSVSWVPVPLSPLTSQVSMMRAIDFG